MIGRWLQRPVFLPSEVIFFSFSVFRVNVIFGIFSSKLRSPSSSLEMSSSLCQNNGCRFGRLGLSSWGLRLRLGGPFLCVSKSEFKEKFKTKKLTIHWQVFSPESAWKICRTWLLRHILVHATVWAAFLFFSFWTLSLRLPVEETKKARTVTTWTWTWTWMFISIISNWECGLLFPSRRLIPLTQPLIDGYGYDRICHLIRGGIGIIGCNSESGFGPPYTVPFTILPPLCVSTKSWNNRGSSCSLSEIMPAQRRTGQIGSHEYRL